MTDVVAYAENPLRHSASSSGACHEELRATHKSKARSSTDPPSLFSAALAIPAANRSEDMNIGRAASLDAHSVLFDDNSGEDSSPTSKMQLSKPTRSLALISQSSISPVTSPRDADPSTAKLNQAALNTRNYLKTLIAGAKRDKSGPKTARARESEKSEVLGTKSLPTTPRISAARAQREIVHDITTLLDGSRQLGCDAAEFESVSTDSGSTESNSNRQDDRATSSTSTRPARKTMARVHSYSSVEDLKKRLGEEALAKTLKDARRLGASASTSSSSEGKIAHARVHALKRPFASSPMTYSMIEYNSDPLGRAAWQRFFVPNNKIDFNIRKCLESAVRSDADPYRVCDCNAVMCSRHTSPDTRDKFAAVYVLDPALLINTAERRKTLSDLLHSVATLERGAWTIYRAFDSYGTAFADKPVTYLYRFKMFV